jgi:imidazole glycerol phosphate synthase subunit HisF
VIQEHGLGIVRIGPTIHEITSPEKMQEVASSYGAQGVIVSVQRHLVEVVDPNWKGVLRLVEDIGRRVFGAKVDEDRAPAEAQ